MTERTMQWTLRNRHVSWALADQILVSGVNFAVGILLARFLGLAEFGRYSLIWLVVQFALGMQHAFVTAPMLTLGPKMEKAEDRRAYYGAGLRLQLLFALLCGGALWLVLWLGSSWQPAWQLDGLYASLASVIFAFQIQEFVRRYFYVMSASRTVFFYDLAAYGAYLTVVLAGALAGTLRLDLVFWALAGTFGTTTLIGLIAAGLPAVGGGGLATVIRRHWRFARWLVATALLQWFGANYFFLAAGALLGTPAVGALKAAQGIVGVLHVLFLTVENVMPVRAARLLGEKGVGALRRYAGEVYLVGGSVTVATALVVAIAPQFWLGLFYGAAYADYGGVLQGYAALYVVVFLGLPVRIMLRTFEITRPIFTAYAINALLSVALAHLAVARFGLAGVIGGLMLLQIIMHGWCLLALPRRLWGRA